MLDITIYSTKLFKIDQVYNNNLINDAIAYRLHHICLKTYNMSDIKINIVPSRNTINKSLVELAISNASAKITERHNKRIKPLLRAEMYDAIDTIIVKTFHRYDTR